MATTTFPRGPALRSLSTFLLAAFAATQAAAAAGQDCVLHIWPAPALESITEGWLLNQTRNEMLHAEIDGHPRLATALTPAGQIEAAAPLDMAAAFQLGAGRVTWHPAPLPPAPAGSPPAARIDPNGRCHAELNIRRLVFARNGMAGGALQAFFTFRLFGPDGVLLRSFSSTADADLPGFPGGDDEKARQRLQGALRSDLATFAAYYSRAGQHK